MQADFWLERWRQGQIGWHQSDFHSTVMKYWPGLDVYPSERALVPLPDLPEQLLGPVADVTGARYDRAALTALPLT